MKITGLANTAGLHEELQRVYESTPLKRYTTLPDVWYQDAVDSA
jgi:hypothetical protein